MLERATRFEDVKDIRDKAIAFAAVRDCRQRP